MPPASGETDRLELDDNHFARELAGNGGARLAVLEKALGVRIAVRGNVLTLHGPADVRAATLDLLGQLQQLAEKGRVLEEAELGQAAKLFAKGERPRIESWLDDVILVTTRRKSITPRSP